MMKKLLVVLMIISLLALCGCRDSKQNVDPTNGPTNSGATQPDPTNGDASSVTDPTIDWETPIDIDDSVTDPEGGEETDPAVTDPTEPGDENDPTSVQDPTEATEPEATKPQGSTPPVSGGSDKTGPIELPMIPG